MLEYVRAKKKDERYTPKYMIYPILKHINKSKIIWCPFDDAKSNFVKVFLEEGFKCVYSHLNEGKDFFIYQPKKFDIIISNPPFSEKLNIFKRLWSLNKPFAILMCLPCLNYQEIGDFFVNNPGVQLKIFNKKVSFDGNTASFNTSYFCRKFLRKDLSFCSLPDNNSGKYYRGEGK